MSILEALSYGIPCIVTPGTNMADDISTFNAGWVSSLDSSLIAETIKRAVEEYNMKNNELRDNALRLSQEFYWAKIAEKKIKKYSSVL